MWQQKRKQLENVDVYSQIIKVADILNLFDFQTIPMYWITVALRRAAECFTMQELIIAMETRAVPLVIMSRT